MKGTWNPLLALYIFYKGLFTQGWRNPRELQVGEVTRLGGVTHLAI